MFTIARSTLRQTNVAKVLRCAMKIASIRVHGSSTAGASNGKMSLDLEATYTPEQQLLILKKVNTCKIDELMRYNITEARLKKLMAHRERYGSFKTLSDVLLMQGIDISVLDKFCKSLVKGESVMKDKSVTSKGELLTPALAIDARTAINTSTGIWICGNTISWAQMDRDCNLLDWDCENFGDVAMKDGLVAVVEAVANIVSKVPVSHAYVMESDPIIPFSRVNSVAYYLQLQRQQVVSTIAGLLGTREPRFGDNGSRTLINNVYMIRSRTPARLFDLLIGSEIVSAKTVVEKILKDHDDDDEIIGVHADSAIRESYRSRDIYEREQMNWALLLSSAFVNLSILQTSTLKKSNKKPKDKIKT